jgi:hypothetical protein
VSTLGTLHAPYYYIGQCTAAFPLFQHKNLYQSIRILLGTVIDISTQSLIKRNQQDYLGTTRREGTHKST